MSLEFEQHHLKDTCSMLCLIQLRKDFLTIAAKYSRDILLQKIPLQRLPVKKLQAHNVKLEESSFQ